MKTAVGISLGSGEHNFDFEVDFLGQRLKVWRLGTDASTTKTVKLLKAWERHADAIGLAVAMDKYTLPSRRSVHEEVARMTAAVTRVPVTTGARLADILQEWAVRHVQNSLGSFFTNANVLFFSGTSNLKLAQTMHEYTQNVSFADPLLQLGIPKLLTSLDSLRLYTAGAHHVLDWVLPGVMSSDPVKEWNRFLLRKAIHGATIVVAPVQDLDNLDREDLDGKTIVTSTVSDERLARLGDKGVAMVVDGSPFLFDHVIAPSLLDAMIIAATGKRPGEILEDDYLEILTRLDVEPRVLYPNGFRRINRFAFVIHPLSQEYFKTVKPIELLSHVSPPILMDTLEKAMAYLPPFVYSKVTGIKSPTGVEAEGWLISVGGTPREIMSHDPEFTYRRLLEAAKIAKQLGAQIMGLGAFTKVVGDAGATVARRAPLPITTGNSYSASGALWAARDALLRLRLLPRAEARREDRDEGDGRRSHRGHRLGLRPPAGDGRGRGLHGLPRDGQAALGQGVDPQGDTPDARLFLSSRADKDIADMDMIVTATSGAGKKVLDIMKVKPGCVITDVARPLDLPPSEVAKRPDVLVIESGEIQLPGDGADEEHRAAGERRLRLPRRDDRPRAGGEVRELHGRPRHRVGEGPRDLPPRPEARDEARRNLRGQRPLLRRGHRTRPRAGARRTRAGRGVTGAGEGGEAGDAQKTKTSATRDVPKASKGRPGTALRKKAAKALPAAKRPPTKKATPARRVPARRKGR